ncbi:MAG: FAD-dependent oxidoreductase [Candidatus Bathyarchaeota archaeon]|uniref:NAD(P)/FAD-dependent oxidoreductase n=1 Tax=Candidatus Bathycorpusculum sp. TaxID=2994959 RepID=UPI00282D3303|nr:FAD-dependent oxidoreductase [Candidatus Termiticorpusculum sp.]MCL2257791.1 FAD-dependent oxidoreductase [Candidatus Termiticorpusculum sp.]MCL2291585.1 FAD-dependent oxidoreductase [Candidatus Termiticorpusculum sp.]
MVKYVIIGSGAAGIAAAKTIRNITKEDQIIMISSDETIYSRCMLHKYSANERNLKSLSFVSNDFFSKNNITWRKGECVTGVDTKNNCVLLKDKAVISFDKLLIATGSDAFIPNVGDLREAKNVYSFAHLTDAKAIREKALSLSSVGKIIVIGAGLVGLDVTYALLKLQRAVTVVEMSSQILPLNLDSTAASVYQKLFEQNGCSFRLCSKISSTVSNENGEVTGVVLENGEILDCDMVIVAVGVRSAVKFLEGSGIVCERGIGVDRYLRTCCESVYAAGSVTALGGIWPCAVRQGEIAARNMCGLVLPFTDAFSARNTMSFFDLPTVSVGDLTCEKGDTVFVRSGCGCYQKFILQNNVVKGVILQGDVAYSGIWQYLIRNKVNLGDVKKSVWDLSFADFYGIDDETGEYKYVTR